MLCHLLVFYLASISARARQVQFSVNDDLFAFPQYDVVYSESYIPFDVAAGHIQRQNNNKQSGVGPGDDSPDLSPHLNTGDLPHEHEGIREVTYAVLKKHGRPYFCTLPVDKPPAREQAEPKLSEAEQLKELARAEHKGRELLQGMEGNQCLFYTSGWWTYSFCYKAQVRQFHALPPGAAGGRVWPPQEDPTTPSYVLGKFDRKQTRDLSSESSSADLTELQSKAETNYLVQRLQGGTRCDLTGLERQVEVQFHCNPQLTDRIGWIKETATCSYLMVVYTPRLCSDVAFLPPKETKANSIVCQEMLTDDGLQAWEARKLEEASLKLIDEDTPQAVLIGDVEVGAMKHVGKDGKKIQRGTVVLTQEEKAEVIVMQKDGKVSSMSKADLKKLDLDPEDIEMFRKELEKLAGDKDWKIEKLDDINGQVQLRGIVGLVLIYKPLVTCEDDTERYKIPLVKLWDRNPVWLLHVREVPPPTQISLAFGPPIIHSFINAELNSTSFSTIAAQPLIVDQVQTREASLTVRSSQTPLYDYQPQGAGELEIEEGELLYILEKSTEDDWWKARKKATEDEEDEPEGLIPNNYVESAKPVHTAKALYDYTRQTDEEVSFSEDAFLNVYDVSDPDWTLVEVNGDFGFAPANYIEISDAATRPLVSAPVHPGSPTTPSSPNQAAFGAAANLARVLGTDSSGPSTRQGVPSPAQHQNVTPEASDDDEPAPALPRRPPSQTTPSLPALPAASPADEPPGVLSSPPYNRAVGPPSDYNAPIRSPGGYRLYNISEMVSVMGRRKKMPTTLGLNIATGTIMLAPEQSGDGSAQEWTADKLTHYSIEGKHVFIELIRPSKSLDLHAGAKDTAEAIVATLGEMAGAVKGEGIKEVIAAAAGGTSKKKGLVLYDFMAQGDDEVTVAVGDEVIILDDTKSDDWWNVRRLKTGKEGVMPASYIELTGTVAVEPPSRTGINAGRSVVEQNRLEEERLTKEAVRASRPSGESQPKLDDGPGQDLPTRGTSLVENDTRHSRKDRRSSKAEAKSRSKPDASKTRTWTDHSGSFKVEAQFIGIADGKIHLHKVNGVKIAVPVSKMSPEDLEYVEKITHESIEEHIPVADLIKMKQKARTGTPGASIQPGTKTSDYDWFDFFLKAGVGPHQCERYAQAMVRDSMDESILPDISGETLRTLGLKEGDTLKVMKFLDQKFGRTRGQTINGGERGLFTGQGGVLHNNTSRARPEANRQTSNVIDASAFSQEERAQAEAKDASSSNVPVGDLKAAGFDDDAWTVKPPSQPAQAPAVSNPTPPQPPSGALADLSLLDKPLEPTPAAAKPTVQNPSVALPPPVQQNIQSQQPQQAGATPSFFSQLGQQQVPAPRQRPLPPAQQTLPGSMLLPPQRPLSAPQNPQQSQFGLQPLQPQLTGMPQRQAPHGQSLDELTQRLHQQQFQQTTLQPSQTGFLQPQGFGQVPNGIAPQPTGFQPQLQSFQQPLVSANGVGSPFADPAPQFQLQPTIFGNFSQNPPPGGINSILPPALQPQPTGFVSSLQQASNQLQVQPLQAQLQQQPTGFQPQQLGHAQSGFQATAQSQLPSYGQPQQNGIGYLQSLPLPSSPQQRIPAPLVPQKTGPAPDIRFGAPARKLTPQPTGRKANLAAASNYWILMPITTVMILTGVLRHYATVLLQSPPKPASSPAESRERSNIIRGTNLRNNASAALSKASFDSRKEYLIDNYKKGTFLKGGPESRGQSAPNPMSDPAAMDGMMGMLKGNMAMMIPQTLIMSWINAFFAGFVILRLPFPLTIRFKSMLQSGIMTRDLDVRWVSSLSWYFLCLFGLQGVFIFILGNDNAASQVAQQMAQANPQANLNPFGPGQDPDKMFLAEAENLEVAEYYSILEGAEDRLLKI
ncbi:hypothetical protein DV738_g3278, partial [Chaetothyriales sp. CBS 135597]